MPTVPPRWRTPRHLLLVLAASCPVVTAAAPPPPPSAVFTEFLIAADYTYAYGLGAADLDGDGDVDVVASAWSLGNLAWWENRGTARRWWYRELKPGWYRGNSVLVRDLNGDGRLDIVSCAEINQNELRWWRNEGPPAP